MPCYEVRTLSVEFKAKHVDVLKEALDNLGWRYSIFGEDVVTRGMTIQLGEQKAVITDFQQSQLNQLKRAYSSAALDRVAKKNRWARRAKTESKGVLRRF